MNPKNKARKKRDQEAQRITRLLLRSTKPQRACTILDMSSAEFRAIFKEKP